jgi:hypothetical protein
VRYAIPLLARVFSVVLAVALIGVGVVALVEIVAAWLDAGWTVLPDDTATELRSLHWDDRSVVVTLIIVGVVGLLALALGLWRRPPLTLAVEGEPDVRVERRALERSAQRHLTAIDGISRARVRATSSRLMARVETTRRTGHDELRAAADATLHSITDQQHIAAQPDVRLRPAKGRS